MIKEAIIPLAGLGTRLLPFSKIIPKELLPLGEKTILEHILDECIDAGISKIILVISKKKEIIKKYFNKDNYLSKYLINKEDKLSLFKLKKLENYNKYIKYVYQNEPKGLGDAIFKCKKVIKNNFFLVILPDDVIIKYNCSKEIIQIHNRYKNSVIASKKVTNKEVSRYGMIKYLKINNNKIYISDLVEKPKKKISSSNFAIIGRYILPKTIFPIIKNTKKGKSSEVQITDAIKKLINKNNSFYGCIFKGSYLDCGTVKGYNKSINKFRIL